MFIQDQNSERNSSADAPAPEHVDLSEAEAVVTDDAANSEDVQAQSSGAEDDKSEPATMAEAVAAAVSGDASDPEEKTKEDAEAGDAEADKDPEPDDSFLDEDVSDEEMVNYSKKANARIRQLVSQRNQANERAAEVQPILDFMREKDIPRQDLDFILDLTAKLRHGDFAGFLNGVQPYVDMAKQHTGAMLPADLQDQVNKGFVSPQIASELAQRRAGEQHQAQQVARAQAQTAQAQQQRAAEGIRAAVVNWTAKVKASDVDFPRKQEMVQRTVRALIQEKGAPQSADDAIAMANTAYEMVNADFAKFSPKPKPTAPTPNATVSKGVVAPEPSEPKSMLEAATQGLKAARAGNGD